MRKKFNLDNYHGQYVMHCKTKEEAEIFLDYLSKHGREWCNGEDYTTETNWADYKWDTCYAFNRGEYCYMGYFSPYYTVLEFNDFSFSTKDNCRFMRRCNDETKI